MLLHHHVAVATNSQDGQDRLLKKLNMEISLLHLALGKEKDQRNQSSLLQTQLQTAKNDAIQCDKDKAQLQQTIKQLQTTVDQLQAAANDDTQCQQQLKKCTADLNNLHTTNQQLLSSQRQQIQKPCPPCSPCPPIVSTDQSKVSHTPDETIKFTTSTPTKTPRKVDDDLKEMKSGDNLTLILIIGGLIGLPILIAAIVYCIAKRQNTNDEIKNRYSNDSANKYIEKSAAVAAQSENNRTGQNTGQGTGQLKNTSPTSSMLDTNDLASYFKVNATPTANEEYKAPLYTQNEQTNNSMLSTE